MKQKPLTSKQKAEAWIWAADVLENIIVHRKYGEPADDHVLDVIVPSLRRRADIVARNAKRRR